MLKMPSSLQQCSSSPISSRLGSAKSVVGPGRNNANFDAIARIPAGERIGAIEAAARVEIILGAFAIDLKNPMFLGDVDRPPPNVGLGPRIAHDPLILGRAAGLRTG